MEFFVPLARLPDKVSFPERLREKVAYDAEQRRLVYRGFMTKCTYDELSVLSDDPDYHRALEQLFVLTSAAAMPQPRRKIPVAFAAAAAAIAVAAAAIWFTVRASTSQPAATPPTAAVATAGAQ